VYKAKYLKNNSIVALKRIKNPKLLHTTTLKNEVQILWTLKAFEIEGHVYFMYEYMD